MLWILFVLFVATGFLWPYLRRIRAISYRVLSIRSWASDYSDAIRPHTLGTGYVNFQMQEEGARVKAMYGKNYDRLARIKAQYDGDNTFSVNQNIRPAA